MDELLEKIIALLNEEALLNKQELYRILKTPIPVSKDFGEKSIFFCQESIPKFSIEESCTALGMLNGILDGIGIGRVAMIYEQGEDGKSMNEFTGKFTKFIP